MNKAKTAFFGFFGFIIIAIISDTIGLPPIISTLLGYVGGIVFCYTVVKLKWVDKI
jgi:hypothetical protein